MPQASSRTLNPQNSGLILAPALLPAHLSLNEKMRTSFDEET
ncbi:uncharacterized protein FTOL_08241 [Fusarium torulosum]|uniref:Uncharacterized protein n=1 Tax=Fusarium torulosum TaxID=33205 RepID=A0AAE8MDN3_9HYPO|nr:uncharacterized protein FTOL_08241 [Fusarium torulosum]